MLVVTVVSALTATDNARNNKIKIAAFFIVLPPFGLLLPTDMIHWCPPTPVSYFISWAAMAACWGYNCASDWHADFFFLSVLCVFDEVFGCECYTFEWLEVHYFIVPACSASYIGEVVSYGIEVFAFLPEYEKVLRISSFFVGKEFVILGVVYCTDSH